MRTSSYIEGAKDSETDKLLHDLFDYYEAHYESEYNKDFQSDDEMSFSYTFHPPYNEIVNNTWHINRKDFEVKQR